MVEKGEPAVSSLPSLLKDPENCVRWEAAFSLCVIGSEIGPRAKVAVPALIEALGILLRKFAKMPPEHSKRLTQTRRAITECGRPLTDRHPPRPALRLGSPSTTAIARVNQLALFGMRILEPVFKFDFRSDLVFFGTSRMLVLPRKTVSPWTSVRRIKAFEAI